MTFFVTVSCVIRRYVYKEVWNLSIGEVFMYYAEEENSHDRKAITVTCADGCCWPPTSLNIWLLFPFHPSMEAKLMTR